MIPLNKTTSLDYVLANPAKSTSWRINYHGVILTDLTIVCFNFHVGKAATKKQKYEKISEKKMSTPVEVLCKVMTIKILVLLWFSNSIFFFFFFNRDSQLNLPCTWIIVAVYASRSNQITCISDSCLEFYFAPWTISTTTRLTGPCWSRKLQLPLLS